MLNTNFKRSQEYVKIITSTAKANKKTNFKIFQFHGFRMKEKSLHYYCPIVCPHFKKKQDHDHISGSEKSPVRHLEILWRISILLSHLQNNGRY